MANKGYNYNHPNTLWLTIQRKLEVDIINGKYKSTDKVPSINELSEMYEIGQSTAKKVLENMFKEGTVTKQQGVGYFVKPFTKEKLKKKYMEELEYGLNKYIYMANQLGVSIDVLRVILEERIDDIYSR